MWRLFLFIPTWVVTQPQTQPSLARNWSLRCLRNHRLTTVVLESRNHTSRTHHSDTLYPFGYSRTGNGAAPPSIRFSLFHRPTMISGPWPFKGLASSDWLAACLPVEAKGGCHEDQDECDGRIESGDMVRPMAKPERRMP